MSNPKVTVESVEEGLVSQSLRGVEIEVPHGGSDETPMTVDESGITNQNSATTSTDSGGSRPGRKINSTDVKNVFRASNTTGVVRDDQIKRIKQMHDKFSEGVIWDFNYTCLLVVASVVAGIGLVTDSSTTVISSMLLSPIMGPVLGWSYGLIIWDKELMKRAARNELLSIVFCIFLGFIIGACTFWTETAEEWPTDQMLSRGTWQSFYSGIPIAFFSGMGVALGVLDDQMSSLVGVSISVSLLPPAVNSGIFWFAAMIKFRTEYFTVHHYNEGDGDDVDYNNTGFGALSLLLTLSNIIMVAIGASLMFRLKEVLPVRKNVFWDDLKVARRIYQGRAFDASGMRMSVEHVHGAARETVDSVKQGDDQC